MFDWNDEELTNIVWGEARESDDHIVPYPGQIEEKPAVLFGDPSKKEINQQTTNISSVEQKKPTVKSEYAVELDSSPKYDTCEPVTGVGPHSETSSSNAAKADPESIDVAASSNIANSSKNVSLRDETSQFAKESDIFENTPEDGEHSDFVDYSWANIGSFDDLDRIFSNNDPIFGDSSAGNVDELWPSSKDVTSSPLGPDPLCGDSFDLQLGALRTSIDESEIKDQHMLDPSQSFISGYEKLNVIASQAPEDVQASLDTNEYSGGKSNLLVKEKFKDQRQKRLLKGQMLGKKSPSQQVNSHCTPKIINPCPPLVLTQQMPYRRPEPFQQNHRLSGVPLASPMYGNMVNHYSGYKVSSANAISLKHPANAPTMTPREKIEKLRRRQQMRAILAIQKQQQQFGNHVSVPECSGMEAVEMEIDENRNSFPSVEPNTPVEQYDSNANGMAFDNCSVEESVIHRLQDTISKLDIRIRLCIRDSLFRLAQSAMQRQYPNNASSARISGRDEVGRERFNRMADVETDTNPIDRTVAHLLFHRPIELSGRPAEAPQSPVSAAETSKMK
ncbi:hypothetical protein ABFS82_02G112200 [Erythranthe guttata]|uniref:Protein LNK2 n=1 Tax=Erythranthe guttata TaxID=4155 RepID=A0A022RES7_ERYGU|nr:PREDICTED: uncharacterized protein LOC105957040 isoform X1 [Erythranthe guttata]EYU38268.1 hypothetical protein MIMGU_mgv1a003852mg [Erythranthe guttata]|eukprot:XP_012836407.1 PREDICTED: uncharacterized protein LOC105957040 isoform X1 [Erythranthe guttata]